LIFRNFEEGWNEVTSSGDAEDTFQNL